MDDPKLDAEKYITVKCYLCKGVLTEPGALVFSPPSEDGRVYKRHICVECWGLEESLTEQLLDRDAQLAAANTCSTCNGMLHPSGLICICDGTNQHEIEVRNIRRMAWNAMSAESQLAEANQRATNWEEDARRYARNSDYWRERAESAEAQVTQMKELLKDADSGLYPSREGILNRLQSIRDVL